MSNDSKYFSTVGHTGRHVLPIGLGVPEKGISRVFTERLIASNGIVST